MVYLPTNFINSNYRYSINNYYYTVRTNKNCYTQYSTTYCDCYDIYYTNNYLISNAYQCNYSTTSNLDYSNFTDSYWYRYDLYSSLFIFFILSIFILYLPYKIFSKVFGRWLKL